MCAGLCVLEDESTPLRYFSLLITLYAMPRESAVLPPPVWGQSLTFSPILWKTVSLFGRYWRIGWIIHSDPVKCNQGYDFREPGNFIFVRLSATGLFLNVLQISFSVHRFYIKLSCIFSIILYVIEFVAVHNGIITNYKDLKKYLESHGFIFESETDTETIPKLIKHIYDKHPDISFRELVEQAIQQIEGAFALAIKSRHFPGECVATR